MSVLLILIPVSLALSATFVWLCIASIHKGQFDDLESPAWRALFTDADSHPLPPLLPNRNPIEDFPL